MSTTIRFHLDHDINFNTTFADSLRRRGIDVTVSWDVGIAHVRDEDQLGYARREGRVLVTHDTDLIRIGRGNTDHAGIIQYGQDELSIGDAIRGLRLV